MTRQSILSIVILPCICIANFSQEAWASSSSSSSSSPATAAAASTSWGASRLHSGHFCFLFHSPTSSRFIFNHKCARRNDEQTFSALGLSKSSSIGEDSDRSKKGNGSSNSSWGKRMKKSEIDNLVRGIGLEPVVPAAAAATTTAATAALSTLSDINTQTPSSALDTLSNTSPEISIQTQLDYSRHGHAVLRSFLPTEIIEKLRSELVPYTTKHALSAWRQKVEVQLTNSPEEYHRNNVRSIVGNLKSVEECQELLESFGIDPFDGDLPFLQHFNIWRSDNNTSTPVNTVRELCLSPYLAHAASILLDVPSVRLYQDSLFHKRVGDGWTPWHSDSRMSPFDTSKMISFWIPLQYVPLPEDGGTGLLFVDGSHSDFALPFWNGVEGNEYERLENRYGDEAVRHHMPLEVGSVTVHNGWTLHCADSAEFYGEDAADRFALSITYVDVRAEVREDVVGSPHTTTDNTQMKDGDDAAAAAGKGDNEDAWSFRSWVGEVKPRVQFRNSQVPIVWPIDQRECA